jgi:hypothetical protein
VFDKNSSPYRHWYSPTVVRFWSSNDDSNSGQVREMAENVQFDEPVGESDEDAESCGSDCGDVFNLLHVTPSLLLRTELNALSKRYGVVSRKL